VPLQRFQSLDDARRALWIDPDDPTLSARIRSVWRFSARLVEPRIPRGVRRFRRIEDANAERERWVADRVNALIAAGSRAQVTVIRPVGGLVLPEPRRRARYNTLPG